MKSSNVVTNAPLALEQMALETVSDVLRRILGLPRVQPLPGDGPLGGQGEGGWTRMKCLTLYEPWAPLNVDYFLYSSSDNFWQML
jgi:hypothetical protein